MISLIHNDCGAAMRRFAWCWLVVILSIPLAMGQAQDIANWTILHYTAVDNNLEGAAFNDYYEMQTTGSGEGVNIVAQLDRAEGHEARFGDWTDTRRFLIEQVPAQPVPDITGKRAALLATTPGRGGHETQLAEAESVAADLGLSVKAYRASSVTEIGAALDAMLAH